MVLSNWPSPLSGITRFRFKLHGAGEGFRADVNYRRQRQEALFMAYIPDQNKAEIKRRLRKELREDVTLNFFTAMSSTLLTIPGRECPTCPQNQKLLEELTSLSPKLHFKIYDFSNPN